MPLSVKGAGTGTSRSQNARRIRLEGFSQLLMSQGALTAAFGDPIKQYPGHRPPIRSSSTYDLPLHRISRLEQERLEQELEPPRWAEGPHPITEWSRRLTLSFHLH